MAISLILATINCTKEVRRLVQSLLVQTARCFELIVVDQNLDGRLLPLCAKSPARRTGRTPCAGGQTRFVGQRPCTV